MSEEKAQIFSSVISEIKIYDGNDPLLPWLRGIRKMKQALSPGLLKQKLPRFLQKCVQTFKEDRRYRNDARFVQVCVRLMDFVDDPGELLKMMESCMIGTKRALFYQAYALYYEKRKRYAESEQKYQLGVKNLAVPMDELQKSYEQFLDRIQAHNRRKAKMRELSTLMVSVGHGKVHGVDKGYREATDEVRSTTDKIKPSKEASDSVSIDGARLPEVGNSEETFFMGIYISQQSNKKIEGRRIVEPTESCPCFTVSIKSDFDDAEDAKIAKENLHFARRICNSSAPTTSALKEKACLSSCFSLVDLRNEGSTFGVIPNSLHTSEEIEEFASSKSLLELLNGEVEAIYKSSSFCGEDTIMVSKFVGCATVGKPEAEDACHHGLVDPTINTKEVMDDINGMFIKPLDVQAKNRQKGQHYQVEKLQKQEKHGIFVDECSKDGTRIPIHATNRLSSGAMPHGDETIMIHRFTDAALVNESDSSEGAYHHGLVEPTLFTKEAMKEINSMFGKPLEFERLSAKQRQAVHDTTKHSTRDTFEILVDDDAGDCSTCRFGNESTCFQSQGQLRCDPKLEKFDPQKKKENYKSDNTSRGILTILADDDHDEESGNCDDNYVQFNSESQFLCGSQTKSSLPMKASEDTVVSRFIGTAVVGEPEAENACHHCLMDPTTNLKEVMSDINSMFKNPLVFGKTNRRKREGNDCTSQQQPAGGFTILVDDSLVGGASGPHERSGQESELFDPTVITKEAMADINDMFGRPLDF